MIEITRFALFGDRTLGRLKIDDLELWTIERPWLNNVPFKSCIPDRAVQSSDAQIPQGSGQTHGRFKTFLIGLISCSTLLILLLMSWAALVVGLVFTLILMGSVAVAKQWGSLTAIWQGWMKRIWS
jgi:hypothetical protein